MKAELSNTRSDLFVRDRLELIVRDDAGEVLASTVINADALDDPATLTGIVTEFMRVVASVWGGTR